VSDIISSTKTAVVALAVGIAHNNVCSRGVSYDAQYAVIGTGSHVCIDSLANERQRERHSLIERQKDIVFFMKMISGSKGKKSWVL
jgi:hypothetical protein